MLPATFKFNQSNLQDFVDCARRFQLRYIDAQAWPGVQAEPVLEHERQLERGAEFHRLVERHQLGMEMSALTSRISDPDLLAWWESYLGFEFLHQLGGDRYPEYTLSTRLAGVTLTATFDLLAVIPGERIVIFDWKTYNRVPERRWLAARLQTRVYAYVLASAGAGLFGAALVPDQVMMVYWISGSAAEPVVFEYDVVQYERDVVYLSELISGIESLGRNVLWPLTADSSRCRFCGYRSLCGRGVVAGVGDELSLYDSNSAWESAEFLGLLDVEESGF